MGLPGDTLGGDYTGVLFNWVNSAFFFTFVCRSRLNTTLGWRVYAHVIDSLSSSNYGMVETLQPPTLARMLCHRVGHMFDSHGVQAYHPRY
jgi:hypothetical protein